MLARRGAATAEERVEHDRLALAETTALTISAFIDAHLATLRTLSRSPDVRDLGNRPNLQSMLDQSLMDMPDWERVEVYQADGRFIAGAGPGTAPDEFTDRAALTAALAERRPVVGAAVAGRRPGAPTVPLLIGVEFVNSATGVMVAWLSTGRLLDALAASPQRVGIQVEVLDRGGEVFIRSQGEARLSATSGAGDAARPALSGESGFARARGEDGQELVAAFAPVERAGWAVLATQPADRAFASIRRQLRDELILLGSAGALIALVTLMLGERLTRSYQRQIETTARVDQFISSASHDLKTPLTAIKTLAQLLQRRLARADLPEADWFRDGLADIDTQTNRMAGQIDELLDLSRFRRTEPVELRRRPTDLVRLARRAANEVQKLTTRHAIRVETELTELTGQWDAERIDRVIANLLSNAVKYSPAGGDVIVTLTRERLGAADYAVMAVQDHGIGIPAADLAHVFDQFRRGSNVTGRISGTGIGLAGVRRLVEEHGGSIAAESSEGAGARFTVRLPLAEPRPSG